MILVNRILFLFKQVGMSYWLYNGFVRSTEGRTAFQEYNQVLGEALYPPYTQSVQIIQGRQIKLFRVLWQICKSIVTSNQNTRYRTNSIKGH